MNVLVVVAHSDDETIGAGGYISRLSSEGHEVSLVVLTDGVSSRDSTRSLTREAEERRKSCHRAAAILGIRNIHILDYPDNQLDTIPLLSVAKELSFYFELYLPSLVLTHSSADLNIDHRICHEAVLINCRPLFGSTVSQLLYFEIPSSTHWLANSSGVFKPKVFVNISAYLSTKIQALQQYGSEIPSFNHARSLDSLQALARWHGSVSGTSYAESFECGYYIIR